MLGYRVLDAGTGRDGLTLYQEHRRDIDLVISDVVMPEMGGVAFYRALTIVEPAVKIVFMSGYPLHGPARHFLEQGVVAWLPKPFSIDDLAHKVRETMKR